jgi:hypothetical protein
MTAPGPSGRPERDPEPHVIRKAELISWGLDPAGWPYSGDPADAPRIHEARLDAVPADAPQSFPERVGCPSCEQVTEMPERGSDDELELFWNHLRTHTQDPLALLELWTTAMGGTR